nr:ABC transporter substrate-binding protein [Nocardia vinacea]
MLSPDVFSVITSPIALSYGAAAEAKKMGDKLGIAYAAEAAAGGQVVAMMHTFCDGLGLKLASTVKLSSSAADYTVFCQQLQESGANSYFLAFASVTSQKITNQCFQQGTRIPQLLSDPAAVPAWKPDAGYDCGPVIDGVAPFFYTSIAGQKAYRDALSKYAPALAEAGESSSTGTFAWASAQLIAVAASTISTETRRIDAECPVRHQRRNPRRSRSAFDLHQGETSAVNCYFAWKVSGGNYVAPNGSTPTCAPTDAIAPIERAAIKAVGGSQRRQPIVYAEHSSRAIATR